MHQTTTWLRNLGGLLVACVLALVVVAPTMSVASCLCDAAPIVTVETGPAVVRVVQSDPQDHDAPCEAACCVSGHCHHGGAVLDTPVTLTPSPVPVAAEHAMTTAHVLASRTISGPDRPPRA